MGYTRVRDYAEGKQDWINAGLSVESNHRDEEQPEPAPVPPDQKPVAPVEDPPAPHEKAPIDEGPKGPKKIVRRA